MTAPNSVSRDQALQRASKQCAVANPGVRPGVLVLLVVCRTVLCYSHRAVSDHRLLTTLLSEMVCFGLDI
jgi:hypothetical protein